jgi:hypothetical protein
VDFSTGSGASGPEKSIETKIASKANTAITMAKDRALKLPGSRGCLALAGFSSGGGPGSGAGFGSGSGCGSGRGRSRSSRVPQKVQGSVQSFAHFRFQSVLNQ